MTTVLNIRICFQAYDDLTQQGQDMEDRYFDEEEPGIGTSTPRSTVYTGELDY